ncbi:hypothetical protein JCM11251_006173 [Rhodosporidiobolus azoricus]
MPRYTPYLDLDAPSSHHRSHRHESSYDPSLPHFLPPLHLPVQDERHSPPYHPYARPPPSRNHGRRRKVGAEHPSLLEAFGGRVRIIGPDEESERVGGLGRMRDTVHGGLYGSGWGGLSEGGVGGGGREGRRKPFAAHARPEERQDVRMSTALALEGAGGGAEQGGGIGAATKKSRTTTTATLLLHPLPLTLSRSDALALISPFWPEKLESISSSNATCPSADGPASSSSTAAAPSEGAVRVVLMSEDAVVMTEKGRRGELKWAGNAVKVEVEVDDAKRGEATAMRYGDEPMGMSKNARAEEGEVVGALKKGKGKERVRTPEGRQAESTVNSTSFRPRSSSSIAATPRPPCAFRPSFTRSIPAIPSSHAHLFRTSAATAKKMKQKSAKDEQVKVLVGQRKMEKRMERMDLGRGTRRVTTEIQEEEEDEVIIMEG